MLCQVCNIMQLYLVPGGSRGLLSPVVCSVSAQVEGSIMFHEKPHWFLWSLVLWFSCKVKWLVLCLDFIGFDLVFMGLNTTGFSDLGVGRCLCVNPDMAVYSSGQSFQKSWKMLNPINKVPPWMHLLHRCGFLDVWRILSSPLLPNNRLPATIDFLTVTMFWPSFTVMMVWWPGWESCPSWNKSAHFVWWHVSANDDVPKTDQKDLSFVFHKKGLFFIVLWAAKSSQIATCRS